MARCLSSVSIPSAIPKGAEVPQTIELARSTEEEKQSQLQRLADFHQRHADVAPQTLAALQQAAINNENVLLN